MGTKPPKKELWYYDSMIDWMIANPGRPMSELATHVNRKESTISVIMNSDMFKAALSRRRQQYRLVHDVGLVEKTTKVAHASLDALLTAIEKKKDTIPLDTLKELTDSALTRLGYGVQPSPVAVQINNNNSTTIHAPVSQQDLEEARMALRTVQGNRGLATLAPPAKTIEHIPSPRDPLDVLLDIKAAEPVDGAKGDVDASATNSA